MKCPVHNEEIRLEYGRHEVTGYCSKCGRHYRKCMATKNMDSCDLAYAHEGLHISKYGLAWDKF